MDLQSFVKQKQAIYATAQAPYDDALAAIEVRGAHLADFCLDFTLPGDSEMELKPHGSQIPVTIHNVDEYLHFVIEAVTGSGISRQVEAFRKGFDGVFPVNDLRLFSPDELASLFGKTDEDWSYATLFDAIKADHGYNMESKTIKYMIEIMTEFTSDERREFLQFITGSPKLPIGGKTRAIPSVLCLLFLLIRSCDMTCRMEKSEPNVHHRTQTSRTSLDFRRLPAVRHDMRELSQAPRLLLQRSDAQTPAYVCY
jgi:E3 ubiquitin-protein ligase TRIP12